MSICSISFDGSFIDSVMCIPLGGMLVGIQLLSVWNELYSNIFECVAECFWMHGFFFPDVHDRITVATLLSFLNAALASTHRFCYSAIASSSVVLVIGMEVYEKMFTKTIIGGEDYSAESVTIWIPHFLCLESGPGPM
jgi:hypothetical protein